MTHETPPSIPVLNASDQTPTQLANTAAPQPSQRSSVEVAVNLLWCVPGDVGGSEQYLVRQLLGLASQPTPFMPTLYCLEAFADSHAELEALYPLVAAPISGASRPRRIVAEHTWLHRRTRHADVVHHGGGTAPVAGRQPIVLTIHDLQYLTHPEYLTPTKRRYLQRTIPKSVRRAAVVAVPTEYVRSTVIDAYGIEPDRVVVVAHGVEASLGAAAPSAADLRREYALGDGRLIVYPAITHPHKNHRFLLELMARHWTDPDLRLVLLGGRGLAEADVASDIVRLGLQHRVIRPGRVPDAHRDGFVAAADALVFPSEYEGFGAPVVESMALGTPVICSNQPALAEVVGDAGLVLPLDLDAWSGALDVVADRAALMRSAGHDRAQAFTTEHSGAALADAYDLAMRIGR
jgi:glycosyltransferase involved in cell wall biosynthesis